MLARSTSCPPTSPPSYRAQPGHARPAGPRRAARRASSSTAGRSTSSPTDGCVVLDDCAITHRIDTGDVDPPPPVTRADRPQGATVGAVLGATVWPCRSHPRPSNAVQRGYPSDRRATPRPSSPTGPPSTAQAVASVAAAAGRSSPSPAAPGVLVTAKRAGRQDPAGRGPRRGAQPADANVENFLLVGSDSRAGADPTDPDFGGIGSDGDVTGNRSDTIMVLRRDNDGGAGVAAVAPPRPVGRHPRPREPEPHQRRVPRRPAMLVQTVQRRSASRSTTTSRSTSRASRSSSTRSAASRCASDPGPRHPHRVQHPRAGLLRARRRAGARLRAQPLLRGVHATASGHDDPTSDLGRTKRQQQFINDGARRPAIAKVKAQPVRRRRRAGVDAPARSASTRASTCSRAAGALREAVADGLQTYTLPVSATTIDGNAVLLLGDGCRTPCFDYFSGASDTPPVPA